MGRAAASIALCLMSGHLSHLSVPAVCVLEPDAAVRDSLVEYFTHSGDPVRAFANGADFKRMVHTHPARCVLCAAELPDHRGVELFAWLRAKFPRVPFALTVSGHQHAIIREAVEAGVIHVLHKPMLLTNGLSEFIERLRA